MTSYISCPRIQLHKTGRVEQQYKPERVKAMENENKTRSEIEVLSIEVTLVQRYSIYLVGVGFVEHAETLRQHFSQHPVSADPIIKTITLENPSATYI